MPNQRWNERESLWKQNYIKADGTENKKKLESWLIVCSEKHGKQMRWRHAPLVLYKHFFFFFVSHRGSALLDPGVRVYVLNVWIQFTSCLKKSCSLCLIMNCWSRFQSLTRCRLSETSSEDPQRLHDLSLGSVQKCVHCIIVITASDHRSEWSGVVLPQQSCIGSNVLKWEFCFVLFCFFGGVRCPRIGPVKLRTARIIGLMKKWTFASFFGACQPD